MTRIIAACEDNKADTKRMKKILAILLDDHNLRCKGFETVYDILHSLTDTETKVIETLFFYKVSNGDEFN